MSQRKIAAQLGVNKATVESDQRTLATQPLPPEILKVAGIDARRIVKEKAQDRMAEMVLKNLTHVETLLESTVKSLDSQGFNQVVSGIERLQKITMTAAGEGQKVEVSTNGPITAVDLKLLVAQILND